MRSVAFVDGSVSLLFRADLDTSKNLFSKAVCCDSLF